MSTEQRQLTAAEHRGREPGPYPWAIVSEILGIPLNSTLKKLPKTIQLRLLYRARDRPIPVVTTNQ